MSTKLRLTIQTSKQKVPNKILEVYGLRPQAKPKVPGRVAVRPLLAT